MPVVISPNGQPVFAINQDSVLDFLRQGYRLPAPTPEPVTPEPAPASAAEESQPVEVPVPVPVAPEPGGNALDLMTANLMQLRALEGVGTARAKEIRALAQAGNLNLNTLQSDVPEVDWVNLYQTGQVTFPGGLSVLQS